MTQSAHIYSVLPAGDAFCYAAQKQSAFSRCCDYGAEAVVCNLLAQAKQAASRVALGRKTSCCSRGNSTSFRVCCGQAALVARAQTSVTGSQQQQKLQVFEPGKAASCKVLHLVWLQRNRSCSSTEGTHSYYAGCSHSSSTSRTQLLSLDHQVRMQPAGKQIPDRPFAALARWSTHTPRHRLVWLHCR